MNRYLQPIATFYCCYDDCEKQADYELKESAYLNERYVDRLVGHYCRHHAAQMLKGPVYVTTTSGSAQ